MSEYQPKRDNERYLREDPFGGDYTERKYLESKLIKTRKEHIYTGKYANGQHPIRKGTLVYYEKCLIDNNWCTLHFCLKCFDELLDDWEN